MLNKTETQPKTITIEMTEGEAYHLWLLTRVVCGNEHYTPRRITERLMTMLEDHFKFPSPVLEPKVEHPKFQGKRWLVNGCVEFKERGD